MLQDKFVIAQLVAFLNRSKFNRIVAKYNSDKYVKHLTCWNQFLAMMFGQLSNRESLRDLIVALKAHHSKCHHLFEEFAFYLVSEVQSKSCVDIFKLDGNVYAFDSTTIDLCLAVLWWAKFRKKKGGIKVHTLYDEEQERDFMFLTNATHISSSLVAELYKNRWQIELFFKWLKQHLKIKKFWGTTENAVRIQIHIGICTYLLVSIVKHDMQLDRSIYEILQILSISLTDKTHLKDLFDKTKFQYEKDRL